MAGIFNARIFNNAIFNTEPVLRGGGGGPRPRGRRPRYFWEVRNLRKTPAVVVEQAVTDELARIYEVYHSYGEAFRRQVTYLRFLTVQLQEIQEWQQLVERIRATISFFEWKEQLHIEEDEVNDLMSLL